MSEFSDKERPFISPQTGKTWPGHLEIILSYLFFLIYLNIKKFSPKIKKKIARKKTMFSPPKNKLLKEDMVAADL